MQWWNEPGVRFVLDVVHDAVLVVDGTGTVLASNPSAVRLLGHPAERMRDRGVVELLDAVDGDRDLQRALGGRRVLGARASVRRSDGQIAPVRFDAGPVDDVVVLVLQDETERVETQAALADSQQRLQAIESLGLVGVWRWDPSSGEVQWSDGLFRIHDLDPLAFGGRLEDHLAPVRADVRDDVREAMRAAVRGDRVFSRDYVIVRPDGEERWVHARADVVHDARRHLLVLSGIAQDVTDDRRARDHIEAARERLDRFAGVLAHDLRAPLTTVMGFADLLASGTHDVDHDLLVGRISEVTRRAVELLDGVLEEARRVDPRPSTGTVDLASVADWVLATLDEQIRSTGSTVVVDELGQVEGNEALLRQALQNLVGNALKYRAAGRGAHVEVRTVPEGDDLELRVDDDGPGIPEDLWMQVLDDGVRVPRDVERGIEGAGIGLATVRDVAERHGTTVTIGVSDLGGARVAVRLRRAAATSPA